MSNLPISAYSLEVQKVCLRLLTSSSQQSNTVNTRHQGLTKMIQVHRLLCRTLFSSFSERSSNSQCVVSMCTQCNMINVMHTPTPRLHHSYKFMWFLQLSTCASSQGCFPLPQEILGTRQNQHKTLKLQLSLLQNDNSMFESVAYLPTLRYFTLSEISRFKFLSLDTIKYFAYVGG